MPGFRPNEGDSLAGRLLLKRDLADRDATLELGLFTNVAPAASIAYADLVKPGGAGSTPLILTDADWTESPTGTFTHTLKTFTGGVGGFTGAAVQGYYVATVSAGGTKRIISIEVDGDAAAPYTIAENDTYDVTLQSVFA